jgi:hypothetical protein
MVSEAGHQQQQQQQQQAMGRWSDSDRADQGNSFRHPAPASSPSFLGYHWAGADAQEVVGGSAPVTCTAGDTQPLVSSSVQGAGQGQHYNHSPLLNESAAPSMHGDSLNRSTTAAVPLDALQGGGPSRGFWNSNHNGGCLQVGAAAAQAAEASVDWAGDTMVDMQVDRLAAAVHTPLPGSPGGNGDSVFMEID